MLARRSGQAGLDKEAKALRAEGAGWMEAGRWSIKVMVAKSGTNSGYARRHDVERIITYVESVARARSTV